MIGRHRSQHRLPRTLLSLLVLALVLGGSSWGYRGWQQPVRREAVRNGLPVVSSFSAATSSTRSSRGSESDAGGSRTPRVARIPAPDEAPSNTPVLLLGDSLAVGIQTTLATNLGARPLTVEAEEGRGTLTSTALLTGHISTAPATWLVSLGTNDNTADFAAALEGLLALAGSGRCLLWFDVWREPDDNLLNAVLSKAARKHPNLRIVPWNELASSNPQWFSGTDVHPSNEGYQARTQLAADYLAMGCR